VSHLGVVEHIGHLVRDRVGIDRDRIARSHWTAAMAQ
jgi:hypothetical protein